MTRTARIAHLGLGAFARSHQAWYTQEASDEWGIVAFPSRISADLVAQAYRYGLLVRGPRADHIQVIDSIVTESSDALESPDVAIATLTVTEAGYLPDSRAMSTLADALHARMRTRGGPITMLPCDNVASNGTAVRDALLATADTELADWISANVSFVSTMVDRITPATTDDDRTIARGFLGWDDRIPVVTEPFTEWVIERGEFPAGRPEWEKAGARFVDNVEP